MRGPDRVTLSHWTGAPRSRTIRRFGWVALLVLVRPGPALAQDPIPLPVADIEERLSREPLEVRSAEPARPEVSGVDRSARVLLGWREGEEMPVYAKWKPAGPGANGFNNQPRYELAAYELQQLFLTEPEYVVPPTVLRAVSLDRYRTLRDSLSGFEWEPEATFDGARSVLVLLQYWLNNVTNADPWDPDRFEADTLYARHWANLNILTHLIEQKDSNLGNLLISRDPEVPRVFAVDVDVSFDSRPGDQGMRWRWLQVDELPAATVWRLRGITPLDLQEALGVLAEFRIVEGVLEPVEPGPNLDPERGVRRVEDRVQLGLTEDEIDGVAERIKGVLERVEDGSFRLLRPVAASHAGPDALVRHDLAAAPQEVQSALAHVRHLVIQ